MNENIPELKIGEKVRIGNRVFYLTDIRMDNPDFFADLPCSIRRDVPEYFLLPRHHTTATLKFEQY